MNKDVETITKVSILLDTMRNVAFAVQNCTPIGDAKSKIIEVSFADASYISSCMSLIVDSSEKMKILLGLETEYGE